MRVAGEVCAPKEMGAEEPLFILYTSGSTGKPKGVLHTCGGYLLYAALTHERVFDYRPGDIYWCTADIGWITGHSYLIYGPLANGATTLMYEGVPNYPDVTRIARIIDKHRVNILYTAPTAIRAMMAEGRRRWRVPTVRACACSARWVNRSIRKPGTGTTRRSVGRAARSSIPGGRQRPAASSSARYPVPRRSSPARRRGRCSA